MIVTVGGQAASGKTTLAKALAKKLSYKHISAGQVMRDMAKEKGMSLAEFSDYAEKHAEVDAEIDARQRQLAAGGECVVDGRLSAHFLNPDFSVWLIASADVRAARIMKRGEKYASPAEAKKDMDLRDESERKRYRQYYKIDLSDLTAYDLIINTSKFNIQQMTGVALAALHSLKS